MTIIQRIIEARRVVLEAGHLPLVVRLPPADAAEFRAWLDAIDKEAREQLPAPLPKRFVGMNVFEDADITEIVVDELPPEPPDRRDR